MKKTSVTEVIAVSSGSYIEWGPVIAGAITALAITAILVPFGNALGLSMDVTLQDNNARGVIFSIGLWVFWTQLISSIVGGYITGKTVTRAGATEDDAEFRDGAHGLLSWASATVFTAIGIALTTWFAAFLPQPAEQAPVNADLVERAAIVFGFVVAASAIVSAVAAWMLAIVGGDHRDKQLDLRPHLLFRTK